MPKALINEVTIHYESYGSGFPLILAYGLGGNTGQWQPQISALSEGRRLILWDPRGHGQSESPSRRDQYSLDISAEDLLGLMDHLNLPKAYVGGLSMGGAIATRFTVAHPERVAALLIIDSATASGIPLPTAVRASLEKNVELADTQGMEAVADHAIAASPNIAGRVRQGPEAVRAIRKVIVGNSPVGYSNTIQAILASDSITDRLPQIKAPTLVLVGDEDTALPAAHVTHERIASSELVIIPDAGHLSNLEQPSAFNRAMLMFLAEVDARR
ncbi:MAG: alpha/beta fold hydrolase [Chloroflexi bacterium]|nr:alpha/beta fold hydrolase [Chloroflexota bacterium]